MSISPLAYADSLRVGTVDFVSPDEIKALLELDAPDVVALNTGSPHSFPRVNGYVLIPSDGGYLVGQIEWMTIERSPYPKRKGMQDFGLIDLPYPLRKLSINPLGMLRLELGDDGKEQVRFQRGVDAYPSVGVPVLLPTRDQLRSIVESGKNRRVWIGNSPLAADARVCVDPDRLFGRHLAVLGNTGSGKSCSVTGLIRWSIDAAEKRRADSDNKEKGPHARFIILDPNGEYANAFDDLGDRVNIKRFAAEQRDGAEQLNVPLWFWNSEEWCAFTQAGAGAQRPLLRRALREIRGGTRETSAIGNTLRLRLSNILVNLRSQARSGASYEGWKLVPKLKIYETDVASYAERFSEHKDELEAISRSLKALWSAPGRSYPRRDGSTGYNDIPVTEIDAICDELSELVSTLGGAIYLDGPSADSPHPFDVEEFAEHIEALAAEQPQSQYFDYLIMRVRTLLSDSRMKTIIGSDDETSLEQWLSDYIGGNEPEQASVTIVDLSLVPAEVVHIITAVIARMTLEAHQRYRKLNNGKVLPTVLVMEEAHTFVKRYKDDAENQSAAAICCQVFEKIAREGRKFGLGLVLSSQRPSELSPTVLSQCNTFLLHRISNDRDQELIHKLVPDNLRGLLRDLPSLPARQAVLLGWASELPTLVEMRHLPDGQRPKSDDPDFWAVWTREASREADWGPVVKDWQSDGTLSEGSSPDEELEDESLRDEYLEEEYRREKDQKNLYLYADEPDEGDSDEDDSDEIPF